MERARELIRLYQKMDGVIGVCLVGSATRPFRDPLSDYDFEVVMDDKAFAKVPGEKRLVFVLDEAHLAGSTTSFTFVRGRSLRDSSARRSTSTTTPSSTPRFCMPRPGGSASWWSPSPLFPRR